MVGIISCGAYIPLWRLSRSAISNGLQGEKAIAGFDEDSITMAVAATMDCLKGVDRQLIDGLFFASTTSPYKEKLGAATIATATDLRTDIMTADFSHCLRAGTIALKAAVDAVQSGSAKQVLVVAADRRLGAPGSNWEITCGDGATAFIIGNFGVAVEFEAYHSVCDEIIDIWRADGDRFIRSWEGRFISQSGYARVCKKAVAGLMKRFNLNKINFDRVILGVPDPKAQVSIFKSLGFDVKTLLQDSLLHTIGDTGAVYSLMLLQAAMESAKEGERILLVSYGNGSDAVAMKVVGQIKGKTHNLGLSGHLSSKSLIESYNVYLRWRELLPIQRPPRPLGQVSPPALWREVDQNIRLYGVKCKTCGTLQYPPQDVCTKCYSRNQFEKIRFSDKRGELFTYSSDHISWSPELPLITGIVNFKGGGRIQCLMAEAKEEKLKIGMPLDMSFRKLDFREGINIYSWKSIPIRE